MNVSLYQAASALDANSRWQQLIAENLASSSVPGFKKQEMSFSAVEAGHLPMTPNANANGPQHFAAPRSHTTTSFQSGEMRHTGVATDVAIQGKAFFEVQLPNGATAYTRDGEFQVDAQGQLVTKEGLLVMSDNGTIQLDMRNPAPITISVTGEVSQGPDVKGRLMLTEFQDEKKLTQISGGFFVATDPAANPGPAEQSTVRQGFLEAANTSSVLEMANLLHAMRSFEANQRVVQMNDERLGRTISELGNPG